MTLASMACSDCQEGSGMLNKHPEPRYLAVGRVLRPHGVHGELKVEILTDFPEHLTDVATVYIGPQQRAYTLTHVRSHGKALLLTLKECPDRNTAEMLRGTLVHIAFNNAVPLEDEEYYHFQVIGLQVKTEEGTHLGEVVDVLQAPGANDVFVIQGPDGEVLLPVIKEVVLDLNFETGQVLVHLLPGLLG